MLIERKTFNNRWAMNLTHYARLFDIMISGIIHIGANDGGEYKDYCKLVSGPITFIEAIPEVAEKCRAKLYSNRKDRCLEAVCGDKNGLEVTFNVASNSGQSSSMLDLGKHSEFHPEIIYTNTFNAKTITLDTLIQNDELAKIANTLVIDTQGADLLVLKGARKTLESIDCVIVEVSEDAIYKGGATFNQIYDFMRDAGFELRSLEYNYLIYGDALFMRKQTLRQEIYSKNLARNAKITSSSVYGHWPPEGVVNGDINQEIGFHSNEEENPFWVAQFDDLVYVNSVIIVDRTSYEYRGKDFVIEVSNNGQDWEKIADRRETFDEPVRIFQAACYKEVKFVRLRIDGSGIINIQQIIIN